MPYLLDDIYCSHQRTRYGSRGDPVTIIGDYDNVLIVEGPDHNRFPCPKEKVSIDPIRIQKPSSVPTISPQVISPLPKKAVPPSRKRNYHPPNQGEIF